MNTQARAEQAQARVSVGRNLAILGGLISVTGLEVLAAFAGLRPTVTLIILTGLSLVNAATGMSYFMRLKFEKFSLVLWVIPSIIFCVCLMLFFFLPDAFRLLQMRAHGG